MARSVSMPTRWPCSTTGRWRTPRRRIRAHAARRDMSGPVVIAGRVSKVLTCVGASRLGGPPAARTARQHVNGNDAEVAADRVVGQHEEIGPQLLDGGADHPVRVAEAHVDLDREPLLAQTEREGL